MVYLHSRTAAMEVVGKVGTYRLIAVGRPNQPPNNHACSRYQPANQRPQGSVNLTAAELSVHVGMAEWVVGCGTRSPGRGTGVRGGRPPGW